MKTSKTVINMLIGSFVCLFASQVAIAQAENLGAIKYTPPKGWVKSAKEYAVVFSEINQKSGNFCFITLYAEAPSTGTPQQDFAKEWKTRVVEPWRGEANPKTETEKVDGWTVIAGGGQIDFQGNKAFAFLSVVSGFGKTVSVLGILNDDSYLAPLLAFVESMDVDKTNASVQPTVAAPTLPMTPVVDSATMHAAALVKEFESNEVSAYQVYGGKRLRIYGTVNTIEIGKDGRIVLTFKSSVSTYNNARCYFSKSQSSRVAALRANEEATVEGTVRGWGAGMLGPKVFVFLEDCVVP